MSMLLAIDQGTTGSTVLVIDETLTVRGRGYQEFPQYFPKPGWVEHDLDEIWTSVQQATCRALESAGIAGKALDAIGITNQRETTALWSRRDGRPAHKAIVWQCKRTSALCAQLKEDGHEDRVRNKTGLVLDPYFSGTKLAWLLDEAGLRESCEDLAFGTIDSFLLWRLTSGAVHATDPSNASRTLLFDLQQRSWSDELLSLFQIPRHLLPKILPSCGIFGETSGLDFLPDGIPIAGMAGDQQAALFGQACFSPGEAKCTYGTGAFLLLNIGDTPVQSKNGLLTTVAWQRGEEWTYALEGSAFVAGAAVQWLRDGLGLIQTAAEVEDLAASVESSNGVVFVPGLAGLGAPHWRPEARGLLRGLDRGSRAGHIARAVLEGIALQNSDILTAMEADSGQSLAILKVDGGACANTLLMQFQADILHRPIVRPAVIETTALGAACLAGLAVGVWPNDQAMRAAWQIDREFHPDMDPKQREAHLKAWRHAVALA